MQEFKTGVLNESPRPKDYILGGVSACPYEQINQSCDWIAFASEPHEMQVQFGRDLAMCTNFSATDAIEALIFFKYGERVNFNERALAVMSGQQKGGNYLREVAEAIRTKGLVPQDLHPWARKHDTYEKMMFATEEEMSDWTEAGRVFLETYDVHWEWVYDDFGMGMREALKAAPLFVASLYASESNVKNGVYQTELPNSDKTGHATTLLRQDEDGHKWIDDSYKTQIKCLAPDFRVPFGIRFHVERKKPNEINMYYPPKNSYVSVSNTGERLLYIEGDYIIRYKTNGDAFAEAAKRNAAGGMIVPFPAVDVMADQIKHLKRVSSEEWSKIKEKL